MIFKEGRVVSRLFLTKNGKMTEIVMRTPRKDDLESVWRFYNKVIKETQFLSRMTPVSKKEEKKWLKSVLDENRKGKSINLFAVNNGKIIGSCDVRASVNQRMKHVGDFGIAVLRDYMGIGLGTALMSHILRLAKKDMNLKIVKLYVYSSNKIAQSMYKKMGFVHAGRIPKAVKQDRKYADDIIMYKVLE